MYLLKPKYRRLCFFFFSLSPLNFSKLTSKSKQVSNSPTKYIPESVYYTSTPLKISKAIIISRQFHHPNSIMQSFFFFSQFTKETTEQISLLSIHFPQESLSGILKRKKVMTITYLNVFSGFSSFLKYNPNILCEEISTRSVPCLPSQCQLISQEH